MSNTLNGHKEVRFDLYCKKCKYEKIADTDNPCDECLHKPTNYASEKPIKFEERTK